MDDVIIVGAGPAGALAATMLARAGARVRVFDRARFPRPKLCGDTLNPGALRILAAHMSLDSIVGKSLPLDGMLLTGPREVQVRGHYPAGVTGRSISRRELDALLMTEAVRAGAEVIDNACVTTPVLDASGQVVAVRVKTSGGAAREHRARMIIAADGRASRLGRMLRLVTCPATPRRWAIGGYFSGVEQLMPAGEMHVRAGHYIGVAPLPGGLANACLVVPYQRGGALRDPQRVLTDALSDDEQLAPRFREARLIERPDVLGPMALDARAVGVPGLLLAGDASGFIDPMTGDGLRFALRGAVLAATVTLDVLAGRINSRDAVSRLADSRQHAFAAKWRFNRILRSLVGSAPALRVTAASAALMPFAFEALIRYAGDCNDGSERWF